MTQQDKGRILMLCGALQDVSEIIKPQSISEQIKKIQLEIEFIVNKDLPELIIETKDY